MTSPELKIEYLPVAGLVPYARNARTHSPAQVSQLAASIREFGFTNPVLVDPDGGIVAGHGRVLAAIEAGLAQVPALRLGWLTEAQRRAYVVADNRLAELAGWDDGLLRLELADLAAGGFDLGLIGFSAAETKALLAPLPGAGLTNPDEAPPVAAVAVSRPGDVWVMGVHRMVCGNATDAGAWDAVAINNRPAMVFSSPPYGVGENAKLRDKYVKGATTRKSLYSGHEDDPAKWPAMMRGWTTIALTRVDCIICNLQSLANNKRAVIDWSAEFSGHIVDIAIWDKSHGAPQMQRNVMTNVFEWIFILSPDVGASRALPLADFHGTVGNVVRIAKGQRDHHDVHRATMPVELAVWAIMEAGPKALSIVDPFAGTGTTIIAAEMTGRACHAIELSPVYVDVAVRRWQNFVGGGAILEGDGRTFDEIAAAGRPDK